MSRRECNRRLRQIERDRLRGGLRAMRKVGPRLVGFAAVAFVIRQLRRSLGLPASGVAVSSNTATYSHSGNLPGPDANPSYLDQGRIHD